MPLQVRFSLDPNTLPTTPDSSPEVHHGVLDGDSVVEGSARHPLAQIRLLPPCAPTKIVCVGRNYVEHAREFGNQPPTEPLIFLKPPSSLIASGDAIVYPKQSQRLDFEGELGVIIGRRARNIKAADAEQYIRGYTIVNDVTARDLQKKDGQWTRGKGFDTFCPVGPAMLPKEEARFEELRIRTTLDGNIVQDGSVTEMTFPVNVIIEYVTSFLTLEPGDLIATGTPPGVGPMQPGSAIVIEIEPIGALKNHIVGETIA